MEYIAMLAKLSAKYAGVLLLLLAAVNIITFVLYAVDKLRARRGKWRISEATLLGFTLAGGSLGALLSMQLLRHKTRHVKFVLLVPLALALHVVVITALVMLSHR